MAESASVTRTNVRGISLYRLTVSWVASAGGTKADVPLGQIDGKIVQIVTDPGSPVPAANYDLTIDDSYGIDVAGGAIQNRHTSTTEVVRPSDGANPIDRWTAGDHTMTFTAVTNANCAGAVHIFFVKE